MQAQIPCQRALFELPDDVAYLNCAYMSPLLRHAVAPTDTPDLAEEVA